jgi:hypothetical protein
MNTRSLRILVAVMGVLLIAGFAGLATTIAVRLAHRAPPPQEAFTAPPIALPHGAKIEAIGTGPDRIVLDISLSNGTRQLVVLDIRTGRLIGTIPLHEE